MTTRRLRRALPLTLLLGAVACGPNSAGPNKGPIPITITFADSPAGGCSATMAGNGVTPAYRNQVIDWTLEGKSCSGWDPKLACLDFQDDVMNGSRHLCGNGGGMIHGTTSANAPEGRHHYDAVYTGKPAGDPEIDILCDTCLPK